MIGVKAVTPRKVTPPKPCAGCGELMHRAPDEVPFFFARRRFHNRACMGLGFRGLIHAKVASDFGPPVSTADFFEMVIPEPNSGCWLWLGSVNNSGYGTIWENGKHIRAHRKAWELFRGPIEHGLHACHKCDVPLCVNPDHLFLGTHRDNMRDMARKGRAGAKIGERHNMAKLTLEQVRAIRSDQRICRIIAIDYGVSKSTIKAVKNGQNWSASA